MGQLQCCTTADQATQTPNTKMQPKAKQSKEQIPASQMTNGEKICKAPGPQMQDETYSMNQPEDEPIQLGCTEEKLSEKFRNEDHTEHYANFAEKCAQVTPELVYVSKLSMEDGIYSGYMKDELRHGPGTLVDKNFNWRMEGIWCKNLAFVGKGRREFNDGEVQLGKFVAGIYQPENLELIGSIELSGPNNHEVVKASEQKIVQEPSGFDDLNEIESVRSEGGSQSVGYDEPIGKDKFSGSKSQCKLLGVQSTQQQRSNDREGQRQHISSVISCRDSIEPIAAGTSIYSSSKSQRAQYDLGLIKSVEGQLGRKIKGQEIKDLGLKLTRENRDKAQSTHSQKKHPISYPRPNESPYPQQHIESQSEQNKDDIGFPLQKSDEDMTG